MVMFLRSCYRSMKPEFDSTTNPWDPTTHRLVAKRLQEGCLKHAAGYPSPYYG